MWMNDGWYTCTCTCCTLPDICIHKDRNLYHQYWIVPNIMDTVRERNTINIQCTHVHVMWCENIFTVHYN